MANALYIYVIYALMLIQATLVFEEIIILFAFLVSCFIDDAVDLCYVGTSKYTFLLW